MKKLTGHAISGVFVFLLLGVFAVMSTVTVLIGANVYRRSGEITQAHDDERILSTYARSMARSMDASGGVYVETVKGYEITGVSDEEAQSLPKDEIERFTDEFTGEDYYEHRAFLGDVHCVTLVLSRDENETYIERLYVYEGTLMERLQEVNEPFEPARGISVCPADEMSATLSDGLLTIRFMKDGIAYEEIVALRSVS